MIKLFPYQYIYYNQLTGGVNGAENKFEMDYWAVSYKEAAEKLVNYLKNKDKDNFKNKKYNIFVGGPNEAASYYFPENLILTTLYDKADYYIVFTRNNSDRNINYKPIIKIERFNVVLSYVKEK